MVFTNVHFLYASLKLEDYIRNIWHSHANTAKQYMNKTKQQSSLCTVTRHVCVKLLCGRVFVILSLCSFVYKTCFWDCATSHAPIQSYLYVIETWNENLCMQCHAACKHNVCKTIGSWIRKMAIYNDMYIPIMLMWGFNKTVAGGNYYAHASFNKQHLYFNYHSVISSYYILATVDIMQALKDA